MDIATAKTQLYELVKRNHEKSQSYPDELHNAIQYLLNVTYRCPDSCYSTAESKVLAILEGGTEYCVGELAATLKCDKATIRKATKELINEGMINIESTSESTFIYLK